MSAWSGSGAPGLSKDQKTETGYEKRPLTQPRILCLCPTLHDNPRPTIESLFAQTLPPAKVVVAAADRQLGQATTASGNLAYLYVHPDMREEKGARMSKALNAALSSEDVERFDYVLHVDADVTLPPSFLEESVNTGADLIGEVGGAMLVRTTPFIQLCGGKFFESFGEDTRLLYTFIAAGRKVSPWVVNPIIHRRPEGSERWRYFFERGRLRYRLGYEPFHVMGNVLLDKRDAFGVLGYFDACLERPAKLPFAAKIFAHQVRHLPADLSASRKRKSVGA